MFEKLWNWLTGGGCVEEPLTQRSTPTVTTMPAQKVELERKKKKECGSSCGCDESDTVDLLDVVCSIGYDDSSTETTVDNSVNNQPTSVNEVLESHSAYQVTPDTSSNDNGSSSCDSGSSSCDSGGCGGGD
jgi:hypothetical protein